MKAENLRNNLENLRIVTDPGPIESCYRDISKYMWENNVLGTTVGYVGGLRGAMRTAASL